MTLSAVADGRTNRSCFDPRAGHPNFDKALDEIGAEYHAILLFPLPNERIDHGLIFWKAPAEWRAFYSKGISSIGILPSGNAVAL